MEKKKCSKCEEVKPIEEFYRMGEGKQAWCKVCTSAYCRAYREDNFEKLRAKKREWRKANPKKEWASILMRNYGITLEKYVAMLEAQDGRCKICGKTSEENGRRLAVDHDHETGEVRWLLCSGCNTGIGDFRENIAALRRAADLLEKRQNL